MLRGSMRNGIPSVCLTRWSVRASPELRRGSIWRSTATRLPSFVHRIQRKAASSDFFRWLQPDDVICCWHVETKKHAESAVPPLSVRNIFHGGTLHEPKVYAAIKAREIPARSLYKIAEACGLSTPAPEHQSSNDVAVMQMLFQALGLAQSKCQNARQPKNRSPDRNETQRSSRRRAITTCTLQIPRSFTAEIASSFCA